MAPEVLKNQDYREKVDMWAIGIILHNIITGNKHPFHVSGEDANQFKATLKKLTKVTEDPKNFTYLSSSLFQRLCAVPVNQRYKASEAL
jgi:serine/threonine protein kinase